MGNPLINKEQKKFKGGKYIKSIVYGGLMELLRHLP